MAIITVNGLSMEFGEQKLFDKMFFEVQNGDRIGLIGVDVNRRKRQVETCH